MIKGEQTIINKDGLTFPALLRWSATGEGLHFTLNVDILKVSLSFSILLF